MKRHKRNTLWNELLAHIKRYGLYTFIVAAIIGLTIAIAKCSTSSESEDQGVVLENTPIQIEEIRPRGEVYLMSFLIEDYTSEHRIEYHMGFLPEKHSCIQVLQQKVSFVLDLDKIEYESDTLNQVWVKLPQVDFVTSTQNSQFISDDEDFWSQELNSTNFMKRRIEKQIRNRYDNKENRRKANEQAKVVVSNLLRKLDIEPMFVEESLKNRGKESAIH